ncbi:MAG TPA: alpha/beta fold hydrolase [Candidatus Omnitrophota bacterium]|nr:alpha/beta fold hydrolase [Candidatus Omnitrophota bacterium]
MQLNLIEAGQGRPLVIMHGLMGSSRNWGAIVRQLGERRRVLALDLPNHGGSPWTEVMDYPFMARSVAEFIEGLGQPAAVVGHSMGGKAAMALALTRPDLVEKLVVVDIAPVGYSHTFAPYIKAMRAVPLSTAQRRADVEEHLKAAIPDPRVRAFLMQNLDGEPGAYRWRPNLAVLGAAMTDILDFPAFAGARYDGPALFLAGGDSDYVLPEHEPRIAELFPHARVERVGGAGHWLHADRPDVFVKLVGEFVGA